LIGDRLQWELDGHYSYQGSDWVRYTHRLRINRIEKLIADLRAADTGDGRPRALDAGCGHGVYSIIAAEKGYDVVAVNIDERELEETAAWVAERGLEDRVDLRLGDIRKLDYPDSVFDLVICSEVLEHLDDPVPGARDLFRVLKENGTAIISMPNMACLYGLLQWTYRKSGLRTLMGKPPLNEHQLQHERFTYRKIRTFLEDVGFRIDYACATSHVPFMWTVDAQLGRISDDSSICGTVDSAIARLPLLGSLGFNFIAVARKPVSGR
jgi:2-polyprenyl-3-methyl-5-hydroxy-6-metoxy-1,4-benzoquinol methylase